MNVWRKWTWRNPTKEKVLPCSGVFSKNRAIRMREQKGICEHCGKEGKEADHRDGSKDNHSLDNLAILCKTCHRKQHGRMVKREYWW